MGIEYVLVNGQTAVEKETLSAPTEKGAQEYEQESLFDETFNRNPENPPRVALINTNTNKGGSQVKVKNLWCLLW